MARYSQKGHDTIRYDITQNIAIRYDMIRSESASPYVRTASKHATAHNTGAPSFCLSTLSPLHAWILAVRRGDGRPRPSADGRCSLKSRVIQQRYCEYWMPNNSSCGDSTAAIVWRPHGTAVWRPHGRRVVAW